MTHHIRRYSTIRLVDGVRSVVPAFSCGPCGVYGKQYRTRKARGRAIREHLDGSNGKH